MYCIYFSKGKKFNLIFIEWTIGMTMQIRSREMMIRDSKGGQIKSTVNGVGVSLTLKIAT